MSATTTATRTRVELRSGWDNITIILDHTREDLPEFTKDANGQHVMTMHETDVYRVSVSGRTWASGTWWVGDTREYSYRDESDAKAKANDWYRSLVRKGYQRIA